VRDEREVPNKIALPFGYANMDFISALTKPDLSYNPFI
jgi:hypothetical protein